MATKTPGRLRISETRDLRENPLCTSREPLDEGGPAVLSMREAACRAGCAYQAPYHCFANREAILAALVEAGFDKLTNWLREARDKAGTEDLGTVVEASGDTYIEFTLTNPGVFRVMFRRNMCDPARFPGALAAGRRAHDELGRFAQVIIDERATPERETTPWASAHGLAVPLLDGPIANELSTLEYRLVYVRRVNQLDAGALMSNGKGGERDDPGVWFW